MTNLSLTFWGGVGTVTGANFLVDYNQTKILVDCGMLQGTPASEEENKKDFPYDPQGIDFLFITHAHIDHVGRIPKLIKDGFRGTIFSSPETKVIAELMLSDAARIADFEARESGVLPIFDSSHVHKAISLWKTLPYRTVSKIEEGFSVTLHDAGHILGSSMFLFSFKRDETTETRVLFTGDLGNSPSKLLKDTEFVSEADYVVMDSVYGDRNHEPKGERERMFKEVLTEAIARKGTVVIPAFSLERTQTILYELNELIEGGGIQSVPVFVDSPLAIEITNIYERISALYNQSVQDDIKGGDHIFNFPKLKETARVADSHLIEKTPAPKVIIAGSGMSTAGRVLYHEALYLPRKDTTLILMGYQAPGTLGRKLEEGAKQVLIKDKIVPVLARIVKIDGYSAHKDSDHLVDFIDHIDKTALKRVFIVMGEPRSALFLGQKIRDNLGTETLVPERGKVYNI